MEGTTPAEPPAKIGKMVDLMAWRLARHSDNPSTLAALAFYHELATAEEGLMGPELSE